MRWERQQAHGIRSLATTQGAEGATDYSILETADPKERGLAWPFVLAGMTQPSAAVKPTPFVKSWVSL